MRGLLLRSLTILLLSAAGSAGALENVPILALQNARSSSAGEFPDCTQCHEELIPLTAPELCRIRTEEKCWHRRRFGAGSEGRTDILFRDHGTPGLIYRFRGEKTMRYYLPADPKTRNPHFNLND